MISFLIVNLIGLYLCSLRTSFFRSNFDGTLSRIPCTLTYYIYISKTESHDFYISESIPHILRIRPQTKFCGKCNMNFLNFEAHTVSREKFKSCSCHASGRANLNCSAIGCAPYKVAFTEEKDDAVKNKFYTPETSIR